MSANNNNFVQFKSVDPKVTYDLTLADRELDEKEKEAEEKATKFSLRAFPRINPIPGRLGFLLRNLHQDVGTRNEMVINFIGAVEEGSKRKFIRNLLIWWKVLDEYSKKRVDIFDLFCEEYKINRAKLWAVIQEGMYWNNDALTKTALDGLKPRLVSLIDKMSQRERNHGDRKLLAEATGLIGGDAPTINDNRQITQQTLNVNNNGNSSSPIPSFSDSIRRSDKNVRGQRAAIEETPEPRQLSEGEQNYIVANGYIIEEDQAHLVERKSENISEDFERELIDAGREL